MAPGSYRDFIKNIDKVRSLYPDYSEEHIKSLYANKNKQKTTGQQ